MKKMKKISAVLLLAAGFALAFGGCSNTKDETETEQGGGQTSGTENPSDPAGDKTPETEPDGVVEIDGEKYYRVTVDGYNTTIGLDPAVDLKDKTKFKAVMFGEKDNADLQFVVKLADADNGDISSITMASISKSPSTEEAGVSEKQDWNKISETFLCAVIQPMVQDKTSGYGPTSGNTVYIGKITAEDGSGNSVDVFDPAKYNGAE